ncbi:hypothetical protein [Sphingomonas aracearum]|uniref:PAS domain-containing protein n=1 Tax=Sphingomonas aracearum TaxID=2283317 RepID=A0A369VVQ8_9SPHN|nr:hypothetical protein [Sphingomonas aracearum]RDE05929.1 hypothetical protein DVW87_12140 [Sphingomonas aracearum]
MDTARGYGEDRQDRGQEPAGDVPPLEMGTDERRMHVRAYNHWVSLLGGRAYPSIHDLNPEGIVDFGPHSVLLDFSQGIENPAIAYLGRALREECALDASITHISDVPARSLLSRLTDHYLQIIANRAPIGFEAEFVGTRGNNTLYRGILMPFSSNEDTIDFIYGVINWKELVDAETQARLDAEVEASLTQAPAPKPSAPVWADGPSGGFEEPEAAQTLAEEPLTLAASLPDQLLLAQQTAAAVRAADTRSRAALYRALSRAHDFAIAAGEDPDGYVALRDAAGITAQARAPMTPIVKLVFGADYDKTRVTEFAAVLSHAERHGVPAGELAAFLDAQEGGIKGVVKAERAARTPARRAKPAPSLDNRPALATVKLDSGRAQGEYLVLLARAHGDGVEIMAAIADDPALTDRALRRAAA